MNREQTATEMKEFQRRQPSITGSRNSSWLINLLAKTAEFLLASLVVLFLSLPLLLFLTVRKVFGRQAIYTKRKIHAQGGRPLSVSYFNVSWRPAASLALFPYVLRGRIALVGGTIHQYDQFAAQPEYGYIREMKPGIFSLWRLRKNSRIGHEGYLSTEWEYCFTRTSARDLLLLFRVLPTYLFSSKKSHSASHISLFDISFKNSSMKKAVQNINLLLQRNRETQTIYFVNPDCLNKTFADSEYLSILQQADLVFPDGIGLVVACKIVGSPLEENINGTDMLPYLCRMSEATGKSLFLLGGRPGVAEKMKSALESRYDVRVAGTHHGYFDHVNDSSMVIEQINASGAEIVLVAFGAPLQEKWIEANKRHLTAGAAIGVGGLFDFYSGKTKRAPRWLREIGLEWFYRIIQEPGRMWRRYIIGNPLFLVRVLLWKGKKVIGRGGANG